MPKTSLIHADDPLLIFGGAYSNLEATQAMLAEAARRGVAPANIICTGDVVAYCADAQATLDLVMQSGVRVVMGNCEESLAVSADDCGCGFEAGTACDLLSATWYAYAAKQVRDDQRAWMGALPRRLDIEIGGSRLAVIHGGVEQIAGYVFASTNAAEKSRQIALTGADGVIGGHCGLPFTQIIDGRLWHNAGAIGMPANEGAPRVWFSMVTPEGGGIRVSHHALDYDHATAASKMRAAGLPMGYADALSSGLWPSLDVLPQTERRATGAPLDLPDIFWPAP
ncbi:MAG: metallophosphoesterase family protein [Beijerinckiaceae bacterium]|nr:metallophosphoesterase family protein [Beijerinckiaceae bacterium]